MKKVLMISLIVILSSTFAFAQMDGTVSGFVYDFEGEPVPNATIRLSAEGWHGGHGHGHHADYFEQTEDDGSFFIDEVTAGDYFAMAMLMGFGHDVEEITVTGGENTEILFQLEAGGHDHGDSLEVIEISGYAIVEENDFYTHYFLDLEGDDAADYRLSFGPPWYNPDNGATRPEHGDSIWIVGGLMGYSEPQTVVVYAINDLIWRQPGMGHGGHGGHGGGDCPNPDSVTLIEATGNAMVQEMPQHNMYFLDEAGDMQADYRLNFGAPWYEPGNGATRPEDGDPVDIVGGLMEGCDNLPVIIVYEINGLFWREPGDTTSLWFTPTSVDDLLDNALPEKTIIAENYPNPFNPSTTIAFELPEGSKTTITVYNILGREVAVLANRVFPAGENSVTFDSKNFETSSSAIYYYKIDTNYDTFTGKMVLLK